MSDRWTEDRERQWRGRDWRSESDWRDRERWAGREDRSFGEDRVFGERDTGAEYNRAPPRPGGGGYGAGGAYGAGESYGRGAGGGPDYRQSFGGRGEDYGRRPAWQDRDYEGVSPAMRQGEYEAEDRARRFESQDYTRGGRYYGDDSRQPLYRQEYGQGGRDYGPAPRGYDADRGFRSEEGLYGNRDVEDRYRREMRRPVSGGTGGYDYDERGYGDGGREYRRGGERGRGGDFIQRVSNWFGNAVGEVRRDLGGDRESRRYAADFGREARWEDPGHRGRGPKGYKRSDERISDDAHQRLTEDPWVDASNISVSVSGGEVTLSGTVETREAKHRAERAVEEIGGVTHVQNNLRVDSGGFFTSPGKGYGDSALESQMRRGEAGGGSKSTDESAATRTSTRRT